MRKNSENTTQRNPVRPGLRIRLLVGLHYLKHAYNVSDEKVVECYLENPYWQYICGNEYFEHNFPCDPTSLVKWRKRIGSDGVEKFLEETIFLGQRKGQIKDSEFRRVNVDTTVQEKAITFPTDAKLYHKNLPSPVFGKKTGRAEPCSLIFL
ncbi:transposase PF05598 domain protein [Leptospira borgpetersenii str. Noumea 25]|uniref:Transporter PF05598 domain protein n=1 Tax=Leptospira borgpetersenii str. 200801926 TaxID=1193009 RepID=A0ABN0HTX1_LEPBO|nr:transporter PF05598 domain protein [Leptospira borgpetersenii str. 200801926]EKP14944.1 transporter PF05598 domain protein [Leptospira borgpetersenii str. 200801926]EKR01218.1 transporter PF05598 domain protein [Leptospira borgpetersenii serovar Castellonis str. 200801910]EMO08721.1 transposase PF05598 domain protein [Leptospira borgpetersenii str. Noumea 25]